MVEKSLQQLSDEYFFFQINQEKLGFENDIIKIQESLKNKLNIFVSKSEIGLFWSNHSRSYDAGWLLLEGYSQDEIAKIFMDFLNDFHREED